MRSRLLVSVSAAALIAGAGFALSAGQGRPGGRAAEHLARAAIRTAAVAAGWQRHAGRPDGSSVRKHRRPALSRHESRRPEAARAGSASGSARARLDRAQDKSIAPKDAKSANDTKSDKKGGATTGQGAAGSGSASLTSEQRSKISTNIRQTNVKRDTNVNFNVSVGTVVPRTVTLHALPPTVIEVYPQWRGYRFVLVEDEIIIIEPGSYRIVAVIDA